MSSGSPVQKLFRRLMLPPHIAARDPTVADLDLSADAEMMRWPLERQKSALRLLSFSSVVTTVKLGQLQLSDEVAPA